MKHWRKMSMLLIFTFLLGCQKDIPEPEVRVSVIPMSVIYSAHDLPVTISQNKDSFSVQHHVKGDSVFIECLLPDISFREKSRNQGKLILYVDGKKRDEISTAAFIIKGLSTGSHQIRLEVVKPNHEPYHLEKEFTVTIS